MMRNDIIIDTLTSVDIAGIAKCGSNILEIFENFFCHNKKNKP